jgi:polygalacturonase
MNGIIIITLLSIICSQCTSNTIDQFGAIKNVNTWNAALRNSEALISAMYAANSSTDRVVIIPAGHVYYMSNTTFFHLYDITLRVEGELIFSDDVLKWSNARNENSCLYFQFCNGITIEATSNGLINGQGLNWWRYTYTGTDYRPIMFDFYQTKDILIRNLYMLNAPRFSIFLEDCIDVLIHDVTIYINSSLFRQIDGKESVTYPLNTDGIDIAGM